MDKLLKTNSATDENAKWFDGAVSITVRLRLQQKRCFRKKAKLSMAKQKAPTARRAIVEQ